MADKVDLSLTGQVDPSNKDYYLVKVSGLKIDSNYYAKFQWSFQDNILNDQIKLSWSNAFNILTITESVPVAPSVSVPTSSVGSIPVTLTTFPTNAKRVDVYIIGGEFGTGKVVDYFLSAGTKSIAVAGGTYQVSLITVTQSNINGTPTNTFTISVSQAGETIQAPTNPNGFSIDRVLSGIQVNWAGTYANGTFTGFEAIKIYVGNSPSFTNGTYREAGVMTGNNVKNTITIPVDGTYLRYDLPVYIHAAAINKSGTLGTVQVNVANNSLGARSAIGSDLADLIITNAKLVDDAVSAAKIATSAITTTKIADDAITTPKLVANAITADKIVSSAITADKIATNAITAGKILAGTIDVTKLAAGTISVNNLEAGLITATSYVRAGGSTGARVELSSSNISGGPSAGFYIYNSAGTAILSAPLTGGLSITGGGSFTGDISGASGTFTGNLSASSGLFTVNNGILTAQSGTIGGWSINSTQLRSSFTYTSGNSTTGVASYITLDPATPGLILTKDATITSGVPTAGSSMSINPVSGIVGPNVTVAGNTGPGFSFSPNGTAVIRGTIYADAGVFKGSVSGGSFTLGGYESTNSWSGTEFKAGSASTYIKTSTTGLITLYASSTSLADSGLDTASSSGFTTENIPSQLIIDSTSVQIYGIPLLLNGLTATGTLINYYGTGVSDAATTQYIGGGYPQTAGNLPTKNYGKAARFRTIIADPYNNNMLKRGFGIYYGTITNAPTASTGYVGDIWISW